LPSSLAFPEAWCFKNPNTSRIWSDEKLDRPKTEWISAAEFGQRMPFCTVAAVPGTCRCPCDAVRLCAPRDYFLGASRQEGILVWIASGSLRWAEPRAGESTNLRSISKSDKGTLEHSN
jgi:hypothetical protein